jgi:hypothetical protein
MGQHEVLIQVTLVHIPWGSHGGEFENYGRRSIWRISDDVSEEPDTSFFQVACPAETLVHAHQSTRCHNPDDHIMKLTIQETSVLGKKFVGNGVS